MSAVIIYTPPPEVRRAVAEALAHLDSKMNTRDARAHLYAITLQEDPEGHRRQIIKRKGKLVPEGPAAGLWQFEQGGGCVGVLTHNASHAHALKLCALHGVEPSPSALWSALPTNDVLAAGCARLLLWTDSAPLPKIGEPDAEERAWQYYLRNWRPGAWSRGTPKARAELRTKWAKNWADAVYAATNEG